MREIFGNNGTLLSIKMSIKMASTVPAHISFQGIFAIIVVAIMIIDIVVVVVVIPVPKDLIAQLEKGNSTSKSFK